MNLRFKKKWTVIVFTLLVVISTGLFWYKSFQTPGMKINCSTILHYDHANPDYVTTIEITFRLDRDYGGLVVLSGNIDTAAGRQNISRNIIFDYDVKELGEIIISNMSYIKTHRDNADDDILMKNFFFVPEDTERQLRLSSLRNAWLLGNPQSPFALCVNKKD